MSRKVKYTKEVITPIWEDYKVWSSTNGNKLRPYCVSKGLIYISIYTSFVNNGFITPKTREKQTSLAS